MRTVPFLEQGEAAVSARVFYQWVRLTNKTMEGCPDPGDVITRAIETWPFNTSSIMRLAQHSMLHYVARNKMQSRRWRYAVIERDRFGMGFRSALYFDYKATRRDDPRVTNRGVTR